MTRQDKQGVTHNIAYGEGTDDGALASSARPDREIDSIPKVAILCRVNRLSNKVCRHAVCTQIIEARFATFQGRKREAAIRTAICQRYPQRCRHVLSRSRDVVLQRTACIAARTKVDLLCARRFRIAVRSRRCHCKRLMIERLCDDQSGHRDGQHGALQRHHPGRPCAATVPDAMPDGKAHFGIDLE